MTRETTKEDKPQRRRKSRVTNILYGLLLACCVVIFSWTGYAASYLYPLLFNSLGGEEEMKSNEKSNLLDGKLTVALLGTDMRKDETAGRSDTLMVAFIDLDNKLVRLLSIPRDTYVYVPGHGNTKINHAFAYDGIELTNKTLAQNFNIDVEHYGIINFQGFIDVIDAVGGVTIDVPQRMINKDEGIDLQPGLQRLDGDQALQFVRFRSDKYGDIGRVARQQMFMAALKDELVSVNALLKIPDLSRAVADNLTSDMSGAMILHLMMSLGSEFTLETYYPAGEGRYADDGVSYYFLDSTTKEAFFRALVNYEETVTGAADELEY